MLSRTDALTWQGDDITLEQIVGDRVSHASLPVLHPDDVSSRALDLMLATDQGRIAVMDPASGELVGLLTRKDLLRVRGATAAEETERQIPFSVRRRDRATENE